MIRNRGAERLQDDIFQVLGEENLSLPSPIPRTIILQRRRQRKDIGKHITTERVHRVDTALQKILKVFLRPKAHASDSNLNTHACAHTHTHTGPFK